MRAQAGTWGARGGDGVATAESCGHCANARWVVLPKAEAFGDKDLVDAEGLRKDKDVLKAACTAAACPHCESGRAKGAGDDDRESEAAEG